MVNKGRMREPQRSPFERKNPNAKARWKMYVHQLEKEILVEQTTKSLRKIGDTFHGNDQIEAVCSILPYIWNRDDDFSDRGSEEALERVFSLREDVDDDDGPLNERLWAPAPPMEKALFSFSRTLSTDSKTSDEGDENAGIVDQASEQSKAKAVGLAVTKEHKEVRSKLKTIGRYDQRLSLESHRSSVQLDDDSGFPSPPSSGDDLETRVGTKVSQDLGEMNPPGTFLGTPFLKFMENPPQQYSATLPNGDETRKKSLDNDEKLDKIASKFAKWASELDFPTTTVNKEFIKQIFSLKKEDPAVNSLEVVIRELYAVPEAVCQKYDALSSSLRSTMRQQILWDQIYVDERKNWQPEWNQGVGLKRKKMRKAKTGRKAPAYGWLVTDRIPEDLLETKELWEGFSRDQLMRYCSWLSKHPDIPKPKYLVKSGYFDESVRRSFSEKCSFNESSVASHALFDYKLNELEDKILIERFIPRWNEIQKFGHSAIA